MSFRSGEYAIFNEDASRYTENECVEGPFYSMAEAEKALCKYDSDDECFIREIDYDENDDDDDEDED